LQRQNSMVERADRRQKNPQKRDNPAPILNEFESR
jgi:hypothetical protein